MQGITRLTLGSSPAVSKTTGLAPTPSCGVQDHNSAATVAKLADAPNLGSGGATPGWGHTLRVGANPACRTIPQAYMRLPELTKVLLLSIVPSVTFEATFQYAFEASFAKQLYFVQSHID